MLNSLYTKINKSLRFRRKQRKIKNLEQSQSKGIQNKKLPEFKIDEINICGIDIVHGCQLRCVGCPNSTLLSKVKQVTPEDFNHYLSNIDVRRINQLRLFNYGEPLLHKNLPEIIKQIPKQVWKADIIEISTNAQTVNWDQMEEVVKLNIVNRIAVSCDGDGTPEKYEELRPPAKWEKLLVFFEKMAELKKNYDSKLELITRTIIEDEEDKVRWNTLLDKYGFEPHFRKWQYLVDSAENRTGRSPHEKKGICVFQKTPTFLYVDYDGTVVPCCAHPQAGILGSLKEQTYTEVMRSNKRLDFLLSLQNNRKNLRVCSTCDYGAEE